MLKPISPFVEYAINYDYISKVLCINKDKPEMSCNGKCQLMLKLQEEKEEDFKSLRILMDEYPIGFIKLINFKTKNSLKVSSETNFFYQNNYTFLKSYNVFHPPIC